MYINFYLPLSSQCKAGSFALHNAICSALINQKYAMGCSKIPENASEVFKISSGRAMILLTSLSLWSHPLFLFSVNCRSHLFSRYRNACRFDRWPKDLFHTQSLLRWSSAVGLPTLAFGHLIQGLQILGNVELRSW